MDRLERAFRSHPAAAIEGPRQSGKTTLARNYMKREKVCSFFDLEKAVDRRRLETPEQTLGGLRGLVVLDEIQRAPVLFEVLRVLLDRPKKPARFLLLGSASPALVRGVSESLAGRIGLVPLSGFDLRETGALSLKTLWLRGGFPRSFLAPDNEASGVWRESFLQTFLERDLPQLGVRIPTDTLRRFWTMIAHYHGQTWNAAEFARALGASEPTARRYLDILSGAFMVRVLPPWFENVKKRQLKAPKIYVRDSGLMHTLQDIESMHDLSGHPKLGASWEGFIVEQLIASFEVKSPTFWGTYAGAELDLMFALRGKRYGFECKYADAPGATKSMHVALRDLSLSDLFVVYPGSDRYQIDDRITALPACDIPALAKELSRR